MNSSKYYAFIIAAASYGKCFPFKALGKETDLHFPWIHHVPEGAVMGILEHFNIAKIIHVPIFIQVSRTYRPEIAFFHPVRCFLQRDEIRDIIRNILREILREFNGTEPQRTPTVQAEDAGFQLGHC